MDESQFKTLRELAKDGTLSQRDLSRKMGLSLGRVNYLVNALLKKGYIKARRFKNSKNKMGYMYIMTPKGVSMKLTQTHGFLQRKIDEFQRLKQEIEMLKQETEDHKMMVEFNGYSSKIPVHFEIDKAKGDQE